MSSVAKVSSVDLVSIIWFTISTAVCMETPISISRRKLDSTSLASRDARLPEPIPSDNTTY